MATTLALDKILAELSRTEGSYPRTAIDAALDQREAITPRLIEIVAEAAAHPARFDDSSLPFHAIMLLGHFADPIAHPALLQLANIPRPDDLIGDALTENLPMILYRTADGDFSGIRRLVENQNADLFARSTGLRALTYGVAGGQLDRDETLVYFGKLLTATELHKDPDVQADMLDSVISNMVNLYPGEWLPAIEDAFTSDRAAGILLYLDDLSILLPPDAETALAQIRAEMVRYDMDDLHAVLADWTMYEENQQPYMTREQEFAAAEEEFIAAQLRELEAEFRQADRRAEAAQQAKRKQKRKQAKASRKKNRKK